MKKIIIFFALSLMLAGCKEKPEEPKETIEVEPTQAPKQTGSSEPLVQERPVVLIDDEPGALTQDDVEIDNDIDKGNVVYKVFIDKKGITYNCALNSDTYKLAVTASDGQTEEGPFSTVLSQNVFERVNTVIDTISGYDYEALKKICYLLDVEEADPDEWLGFMAYSLARGPEAYEDSTFYQNGYEFLENMEEIIKKYNDPTTEYKAEAIYDMPDDFEDKEEEPEEEEEESEEKKEDKEDIKKPVEDEEEPEVEKLITADADICAFYVTSSATDRHNNSDGLITSDALRLYLGNHRLLDKVPITVSNSKNYYLFVYGNSDVKIKNLSKVIYGNMIGIGGTVEYKHNKSDTYKEIYVIIPVEKYMMFSNSAVTLELK